MLDVKIQFLKMPRDDHHAYKLVYTCLYVPSSYSVCFEVLGVLAIARFPNKCPRKTAVKTRTLFGNSDTT